MDEIKMEREIKEMLHQCADELHAPDSMQARVKFALNNAPARKRHLWSKRFVAVAAVAAIAVTGAFAAGGMGGIFRTERHGRDRKSQRGGRDLHEGWRGAESVRT